MFFMLWSSSGMGQTEGLTEFSAERPGVSIPPDILTTGKFQLENGIQYSNLFDGSIRSENYLFSSLLVRYGLVQGVELHVETNYAYNIDKDSTGASVEAGLTPIMIGTKIKIIGQRKVIPNVSVVFNLTLPLSGNREFTPENPVPSLYLCMSNKLSEKLNLCYNYGIAWDGFSDIPNHFYGVCLGISLSSKWNVFIEGYGYSAVDMSSSFYMDTGLAYMINDHLQADISVAGSFNTPCNFFLAGAGIAWKIVKKNINRPLPGVSQFQQGHRGF